MKLKVIDEKKIQVIDKLADCGVDTEKKVSALQADAIIGICLKQGIQGKDMQYITDFQKAIRDKKVYSFLTGELNRKEGGSDGGNRNDKGTGDGAKREGNEDLQNRVEGSDSRVEGDAEGFY